MERGGGGKGVGVERGGSGEVVGVERGWVREEWGWRGVGVEGVG